MILPSKHLSQDRALLTVGADLLRGLSTPKTVSRLWLEAKDAPAGRAPLSYDWFILALDLLFALGLIDYHRGLLARVEPRR